MSKLTKRVVDAIRPEAARDVFVWDSELRGFGVRMKPSGAAAWVVQYRNAHQRTRRLVLGKVGVLTPAQARDLAREKLSLVAKGRDPSTERHAARVALTVTELCDQYLREARATGRIKASTLAMDESRIERHVKPLLGSRPVASLTPTDLSKFQTDVANGRTAQKRPDAQSARGGRATGGRGVASRTLGMLGTILEFARRRGLLAANPARGVERLPDGRRRVFLATDQLSDLGNAMRAALEDKESRTGIAAVRFLALTGFRRMEALALQWDWVDLDAQCIRFPDTKSGAQVRPLGSAAVLFLRGLPHERGQTFVFPADRGDGHFVGLPRLLGRLCSAANLPEATTAHVLRHTFATVAAELGFSELTIAGLLGHAAKGITARYAHIPDRALITAANQVSARVEAALQGDKGAKIVALPPSELTGAHQEDRKVVG